MKENLISNPDDVLVLVNKKNKLFDKFVPLSLEKIDSRYSVGEKYLRLDAKIAFEKLCNDAKKLGFIIKAQSTYRDYSYQKNLFTYYTNKYGYEYANKCSAKPGYSEHQTGLAVDVQGSNKDYNLFEESKEFDWMRKNCYKYGFILRYPKGKEKITGYKYEPWHYRYVADKAKYIFDNDICLEEYWSGI